MRPLCQDIALMKVNNLIENSGSAENVILAGKHAVGCKHKTWICISIFIFTILLMQEITICSPF